MTISALTVVVLAFWSRTLCHECLSRPPTRRGGELWSCCGSGRFGDTMPWRTRGARGARGWDASAIPPKAVPGRYHPRRCLAGTKTSTVRQFVFSALVFFSQFSVGGRWFRFRPWRGEVPPRASKFVVRHSGRSFEHHTARSGS